MPVVGAVVGETLGLVELEGGGVVGVIVTVAVPVGVGMTGWGSSGY